MAANAMSMQEGWLRMLAKLRGGQCSPAAATSPACRPTRWMSQSAAHEPMRWTSGCNAGGTMWAKQREAATLMTTQPAMATSRVRPATRAEREWGLPVCRP